MYQGWFRLFLALLVVYAHYFPNIGNTGKYAVFSFYLVSGYLITAVTCGRYSDGLRGFAAFLLNRVLRIYPAYLAASVFSVAVILQAPDVAARISPYMHLPDSLQGWLPQVAIFGALTPSGKADALFVPVAWSLNVELVYYLLIAGLLGRSLVICTAWWWASLAVALGYGVLGDIDRDYFSFISPSISFATGAMLYHHRTALFRRLRSVSAAPAFAASLAVFAVFVFWPEPIGLYLYAVRGLPLAEVQARLWIVDAFWLVLLIVPFAALSLMLSLAPVPGPGARDRRSARLAGFCGDLSYPIFLLHWPVLVLVTALCGGAGGIGPDRERIYSVIALPVVLALAALVVVLVERPMAKPRARVRLAA